MVETEIEVPPIPSLLQRFSTEMLSERERFSAFQEEFARRVLMMEVIDHSGGRPRIDLAWMALGPVAVGYLVATPAEFVRHKHYVKDGNDDFRLNIVETGSIKFEQAGQEGTCDTGAAYFFDQQRPERGIGLCGGRIRNIMVRAAPLKSLVTHPEDLAGHPVHPGPAAIENTLGNTRESLKLLSRASHLSPRDPRGWLITSHLAWAHLREGQPDKTISAAERVLNQNPGSAYALRFLAAGLAQQGRLDEAAQAIRRALNVEPQLTLTKLRSRLMFLDEKTWRDYSVALRLAGLPE